MYSDFTVFAFVFPLLETLSETIILPSFSGRPDSHRISGRDPVIVLPDQEFSDRSPFRSNAPARFFVV
jgi:hypothetical protein